VNGTGQDWLINVSQDTNNEWTSPHDGFISHCHLITITVTDIFIHYTAILLNSNTDRSKTSESPKPSEEDGESLDQEEGKGNLHEHTELDMELFSFLWFNFLKVLLNYAESSSKLPIDSDSIGQFKF